MSRRRRRRGNSGGNNLLIILIIGIIIYLLLLQPKNNNKDLIADSNNNNGHDIVAIVVGNTMYSPSPELNTEKSIEDSIKEVFNNTPANETPNIVMYSATSEPKTLEIDDRYNLGPAANSIASQSNLKDLLKGINKAANTSPSASGADYFAAIIEAAEYVKGYQNPLIIVYGSGLSDTGVFNFAFDNLISDNNNEKELVYNRLENDNRFTEGEYSNIEVDWYGAGQTVGKQPELKEYKITVKNIYINIFNYFGMDSDFNQIKVESDRTSVDTEYQVNMTPLNVLTPDYKLSINERYVTFYPDTAKLKDEEGTTELLRSIAQKIKNTSKYTVKLTGYQTVCAKTKTLSVKRAETIKRILVKLGVPASQIVTDGVAGPPDNREEKPRCGSTGIATEHRTVILEVIE